MSELCHYGRLIYHWEQAVIIVYQCLKQCCHDTMALTVILCTLGTFDLFCLFIVLFLQVNRKELKKLLSQLTVNYLLVGLPYAFLHYVLHKLRGSDLTFTLPTVYEFITHFVICVLMEEITFYYSHR